MNSGLRSVRAKRRLEPALQRRFERLERLAYLLDDAVRIPGTRLRVGLDPLLGLLPGLGDALGAVASAWILVEARRFGVSRSVLIRMLYNVAIDTGLGAVPGAGDLFDFVWKSDSKNLALLRRHLDDPGAAHRASARLLAGVLVVIGILAAGSLAAAVLLVRYLLSRSPLF